MQSAMSTPPPADESAQRAREFVDRFGVVSSTEFVRILNREMQEEEPTFADVFAQMRQGTILASILTSKVVDAANATLFGASVKVDSPEMALTRLGTQTFSRVALNSALRMGLGESGAGQVKMWAHAEFVGRLADALARQLSPARRATAQVLGLLHDCALPLLMQGVKDYKPFADAALGANPAVVEEEQAAFQLDHALVAGELAERWLFPAPVQLAVRHHHSRTLSVIKDAEARALLGLLVLAERVAAMTQGQMQQLFPTPMDRVLLEEIAAALGTDRDRVHNVATDAVVEGRRGP
jgi:HD-like signal output (HDOD) protein